MSPRFPADSIRFRLLALGGALVGAALIAGYMTIAAILDDFITGRFDAETHAIGEGLIAGAVLSETGRLSAGQSPGDPRFSMPLSGWYWQLTQNGVVVAKSASLFDATLPAPTTEAPSQIIGPRGAELRLSHSDFTLPESDDALMVSVTAPQSEIAASLAQVRRPLAISLAVLGIGLALASFLQVTTGLRSLVRLGRDIRKIRAGEAQSLPLPDVAELRPISNEINDLLEQNRKVLSRNRDYIGNLAHSLKTPLAALANSLPADHPGQSLIARMDRQIGWHLRRARSSAGPRVLGHRTEVAAVFDDILLVLRGPISDRGLEVDLSCPPALAFAGERQDLEEMIGNLTENAVKYTASRIRISAQSQTGTTENHNLVILIEDDGPGMEAQDHAQAMTRGGRLDELGPPGAGLGLAIVVDLAALHGGSLALERSELGGLRAVLTLPAA